MNIVVDWASFESCAHISAAVQVMIEHAFDRIAATVEWFCEWESSRLALFDNLVAIHVRYGQESLPPRVEAGRVLFDDTLANEEGFPQVRQKNIIIFSK